MHKTDPEDARRIRCNWFDGINALADLGLQRRSWLDPLARSPHWSYAEFCEGIAYEDQLNGARNEGWVSPREYEVIDRLCRAVDDYTAPSDDSYGTQHPGRSGLACCRRSGDVGNAAIVGDRHGSRREEGLVGPHIP